MTINVIGHFGGKQNFQDGQTVKTRSVFEALKKCDIAKIRSTDTYYLKRNPVRFFAQFLKALLFDKKIVVLLSQNGRKYIFPVLFFFSKFFNKHIYHYTIGGWFANNAVKNKKILKYIASFEANWVESPKMVKTLNSANVNNVKFVPNFKNLNVTDKLSEDDERNKAPFRFCTFSRVVREKGIEDAIEAIQRLNGNCGKTVATLDIYGPVDETYKSHFEHIMTTLDDSIHYKGVVEAKKSVEVLENYYMLLFPTFWTGEGMPGTVIDALASGLPIIARNWEFCEDMLTDSHTALIYDFDKPQLLCDKIRYAVEHPEIIRAMRTECVIEAEKYKEENVLKILLKDMGLSDD